MGIVGTLLCLVLGIPVGISLIAGGFLGLLGIFNWDIFRAMSILGSSAYFSSACFELCVIPLFIIMGLFAMHTGSSEAAYRSAYKLFGRIPGSLSIATLVAAALFGATCGASLAVAAIFTKISLPEMLRRNYNKSIACGTITAGGCLGMLIPPSVVAVVYGILTGVSIGKLFLGGVGPGIFYTIVFSLSICLLATIRKDIAPPIDEHISWKEKLISLKDFWSVLLLATIVIGGIYLGVFTPTEAASLGAFAAFIMLLVMGRFSWEKLKGALLESAQTTVMIFMIIIGAAIFARMMTLSGITALITEGVANSTLPPKVIFVLFLGMYLIMGMFLDSISMMCITLPIVFPLTNSFGFDQIWTATLIIIVMEIGLQTPPMGLNVYVVKGAAGDSVTLEEVFRGALFFVPIFIIGIVLFFIFPGIISWLPQRIMQ
ncbi:MAG: TRAP transporter large permease [Methanosarcinaceae archaeon]|nr:TRAP transporter large permease [Methanosarcinaceae archaeon]